MARILQRTGNSSAAYAMGQRINRMEDELGLEKAHARFLRDYAQLYLTWEAKDMARVLGVFRDVFELDVKHEPSTWKLPCNPPPMVPQPVVESHSQ
jgi:hypothetical protein